MNKNTKKFIVIALKLLFKFLSKKRKQKEDDTLIEIDIDNKENKKDYFETAFKMLVGFEGYKSYDEWGGDTIYGISKRYYPAVVEKIRQEKDKNKQLQMAKEFYKKEFWDMLRCDMKPYPLNIIYFDTAVNLGIPRAMLFRKKYHNIDDLTILESVFILFLRSMRYVEVCLQNKRKKKNFFGWMKRVFTLFKLLDI